MKRLFLFLFLSVSVKAIEPTISNTGLEEVLEDKKNNFIEMKIPKPFNYLKGKSTSKISFKLDCNCVEKFGESFYDARAGVSYLLTSVLDFETGYELVPTKMDTIEEINAKYIGLYGRFVLKF